ncbi:MAG: hypothetical protein IJ638_02485 [Alphaproteobacteria bacterium]|nr:hypothetical protein [Alphaproteobacteria bacterium]
MAEKVKVKVKDRVKFIKKQIVFLPILLFLPIYIFEPSEKLLVTLSIIIVWHFLCFMSPVYMIRYLIEKAEFNQKFTDIVSNLSAVFMWAFTIFDWIKLFSDFSEVDWNFPAGLFIIPFLAFIRVGLGILCLTLLYKIYIFYKQMNEE